MDDSKVYPLTDRLMPTPKQLEEGAQRVRETVALWVWNDDYYETQLLLRPIIAQAKEELFKREPWMRQFEKP